MPRDSVVYAILVVADLILAALTAFFVCCAVDSGSSFIFFSAFSGVVFLVLTSTLIFCWFKKGKGQNG